MSIAFDAASSFGHSTVDLSWTHTPVGIPRGVIVQIIETLNVGADNVTSVTYGGIAMTRITGATVIQASGFDLGAVYTYFLGSNIPTGPQTVYVTVASGTSKVGVAYTITADADTAVDCTATLDSTGVTDPSVTLTALHECFVVGALHSGQNNAPDVSVGANYTEVYEDDFSISVGSFVRKTTLGAVGSITVNWTAALEQAAIAAIGISELGTFNNFTLFISGPNATSNNNVTLFEKGLDIKNNNINLFELGQDGSNNNISLFISSLNNSNNTFTLFEQGLDVNNNNLTLFIYGLFNLTNPLTLFEQGFDIVNSNIPLFISSLNINNNNCPLYVGGLQNLNNLLPFPLFEQGHLPYNNNLPLFIYGHGLITNLNPPLNLPLYVSGNTVNDFTNYFPLFIGGYTNFDNLIPGFTLFEQGDLLIASGLPLYINGQQNFTSTTPPPNILPLYIAGPLTSTGYIPLYISGPQLVKMCQFTRYINMVTRVRVEI